MCQSNDKQKCEFCESCFWSKYASCFVAVASARERVPAHADITLTESQDSMQELSPDENSACPGDSQQCEVGGSTG